jgi:polyisoprenoid-binding protein YceI
MTMKNIFTIIGILMLTSGLMAQKFVTKNGSIRFFSETPMESIEAVNNQVNAAYDYSTSKMVFKVLMKSFEFEKALMEEHFNENYVESDEFPNATFIGTVDNNSDIDLTKKGIVKVLVKGKLSIHGVTKEVAAEGEMIIDENLVQAKASFFVKPGDYDIKIPGAVVKNIAEEIEVTVDVSMKKL